MSDIPQTGLVSMVEVVVLTFEAVVEDWELGVAVGVGLTPSACGYHHRHQL